MDLPLLASLSNIDALILVGAAVVFLVMAYMIFKQVMKAIIIGIISAAIPIVLYLLGYNIDISLQTIIWFGLAGIATYFIYDVIMGWFKLASIVTWPIRKLLRSGGSKKPKAEKPKMDGRRQETPSDKKKEEKKAKKEEAKEKDEKKQKEDSKKEENNDEDYATME